MSTPVTPVTPPKMPFAPPLANISLSIIEAEIEVEVSVDLADKAINKFKEKQLKLYEYVKNHIDEWDPNDVDIIEIVHEMNEKITNKIELNKCSDSILYAITSMNEELLHTLKPRNHEIRDTLQDFKPLPTLANMISKGFVNTFVTPRMGAIASPISPTFFSQTHMSRLDTPNRTKQKKSTKKYTGNGNKMARTLFMFFFILVVFWFNKKVSGYRIIAWLLILSFSKFFLSFIYLYSTTTKMMGIEIITTNIKGFGNISFPFQIEYHPSKVINSISQLCSIKGSNVHIALYDMTTHSGILLFCAVGFKWHELYNRNDFDMFSNESLSILFGLSNAFGIFMVGVWELNQESKVHILMHYLGGVGLVMIGIAILYQFDFSLFAIIIFALNLTLWGIYFGMMTFYYKPEYKDDPIRVHQASIICITLETTAWVILAATITFFVYNLHAEPPPL